MQENILDYKIVFLYLLEGGTGYYELLNTWVISHLCTSNQINGLNEASRSANI